MNIVMPSKSYTMKVRFEAVPADYPTLSVIMHALFVGPSIGIYQTTNICELYTSNCKLFER